jgi:O-antigen/teichoic acid export membrane protein
MEYFTAFCVLIFLGVTLYMDIIGLILGKDFRGALGTVPFMLLSYMVLGMLFNVSMWYKLSGATKYAIYITLAGLSVTLVVNVVFMPLFSYWASVAAHLLSCVVMLVYSVMLGNKHHHIPYRWGRICRYIACGIVLFALSVVLQQLLGLGQMSLLKLGINTVLVLVYMGFVYKMIKNNIHYEGKDC